MNVVTVTYYGTLDDAKDRALEDAAGRKASGSGYFFPKSERDLTFHFERDEEATAARERLAAVEGARLL